MNRMLTTGVVVTGCNVLALQVVVR